MKGKEGREEREGEGVTRISSTSKSLTTHTNKVPREKRVRRKGEGGREERKEEEYIQ